jgi:hypothetical protein
MSKTLSAAEQTGSLSGLRQFPATKLATQAGAVTREVLRQGAAVITKHDRPAMVLMTVERYGELLRAGAPDLDQLTREFDELYARMQDPAVASRTMAALVLGSATAEPGADAGTAAPPRREA